MVVISRKTFNYYAGNVTELKAINMAHLKKRTNTISKVFKFGARPLGELPEEFWQTAKQMQFIWNDLVQMRNKLTDNFGRLGIGGKENVKKRIEFWEQFDKIWRNYLKSSDIKNRLGGDEREFLQMKFETADKMAKKEKTGLKKQFALDRIYFRHRYSGGGNPIDKFKRQGGNKFSFDFPISDFYYTNTERKRRIGRGLFGVMKDRKPVFTFPFSAVIHREIPDNTIVKSVSWVGKRLKNSGINKTNLPVSQRDWVWSIDVSVEIPQSKEAVFRSGRIAALDVGWRKINDDFLRIGVIQDTDGNQIEIRTPINHLSNAVKDGKLAASLKEIFEIDERKGNLVEATKTELTKIGIKNLTKMREGGLFRLKNQLTETGENIEALEILDNFADLFLPLASIRVRSFDRLNKYRDWLYQNIANWLSNNYDALIWEGKLNLKKMAEDRKNLNEVETVKDYEMEKIRRMSAKYRNFASIYGFRDYLKKAFTKQGKSIIDGVTAYTSRKCNECGDIVEKFANVEFICPNGHSFDRDFNAAKNLLNQIDGQFVLVKGGGLVISDKPNCNLSNVLLIVGCQ